MQTLTQDLRYAARALRRSPGLTAVVVITLAVGIGATATIFSWMDALVLRPFPTVREPEALVRLYTRSTAGRESGTSYPDYREWREQAQSFEGIAAYSMLEFGLQEGSGEGPAERVWGVLTSGNYFDVLGLRPLLGRTFPPEEEAAAGGAPVTVISHQLWQRQFEGDPGIVGRQIRLNGHELTVIGVAPPAFGGTMVGLRFDLWVPIPMQPLLAPPGKLEWRASRWLDLVGRLHPGVTLEQARAEMRAIGEHLEALHPEVQGLGPWVAPFDHDGGAQQALRPVLSILLGMTGLVLLIACANVANLLLARATGRRREIGIRVALGARRRRIVRQLLTESLVLALLGGAFGLLLTVLAQDLFAAFLPASPYPVVVEFSLNLRVLAAAAALTLGTTILFGLMPALRASRPDLVPALKGNERSGGIRSRLRGGLVVAQVALALVTLVSAGLFARSLQQAQQVDPGFRDPARVLLVSTNLHLAGYAGRDSAAQALIEQLVARAGALPGVQAAAIASTVPLGFGGWNTYDIRVEGYVPQPAERMTFLTNRVGPGYFQTMGIPILQGRDIGAEDRGGAPEVAVVNETFARRFWPGEDPVGKRIQAGSRWLTVVGIARDGKYSSLTEPTPPFLYLPHAQWYGSEVTLHLRTAGDPRAIVAPLRREFAALAPGLPFLDPRTLAEHMGAAVVLQRLAATLLGVFGAFALALAAVGLYGVLAYLVAQRTREVGIRMALGAARRDVIAVFVRDGARLILFGLVLGLAGAFGIAQLLRSQLFGIPPSDPLTFGATALLLVVIAFLATYLPARRAARVDPMIALRAE